MKNKLFKKKLNRCFIIAEAGVNHNCNMTIAEKLIKSAKENGADIIKFQTYKAENLTLNNAKRFWKWEGEIKKKGSQFDSYQRLDKFNYKEYRILSKLCNKYKIDFMSTPFDLEAVKILERLNVKAFKIASCDLTNYILLKAVARTKKPIFLSTGASNINEIRSALNFLKQNKSGTICLMHCTLCYPTKSSDANLTALLDMKKNFPNYLLGLSDHTLGTNIAPASILYGVRFIEKHFTINKKLKKSADHKISIDGKELMDLRIKVDDIFSSLGCNKKKVLPCERITRKYARRSLVLTESLNKNDTIAERFLTAKRPGIGIPPNLLNKIVGMKLKKNIKKDRIFYLSDLKK
jgi:sialic acid synthase SpsE